MEGLCGRKPESSKKPNPRLVALSPEPHSAEQSGCCCLLMGVKEDSPRGQTQDRFISTRTQRQGETPSLQKTGVISEGKRPTQDPTVTRVTL